MRSWLLILAVMMAFGGSAFAQEDKKTDDLKPADPDTGESTVGEETVGLLPNPFEKQGVKFAVTYIGEGLGNPTGGAKQGATYEDRINFAADVDFEKLIGLKQLTFHANVFQIDGGGLSRGALLNFLVVSGSRLCRPPGSTKSGSSRNGEPRSRCGRGSWPPTPSS
jgi:porin